MLDTDVQTEMETESNQPLFSYGRRERLLYFIICIVFTILDFVLIREFQPTWQGEEGAMAQILLGGEPARLLYPFLIYSMLCLGLLLWRPAYFGQWWWARLGIYTGVGVAATYAVVAPFVGGALFGMIAIGILFVSLWPTAVAYRLLMGLEQLNNRVLIVGLGIILLCTLGTLGILFGAGPFGLLLVPFFFVLIYLILIAPFWVLMLYGKVALHLWETVDQPRMSNWFQQAPLLGTLVAWLVGYVIAWRMAYLEAEEIFAALPTEDCYVATAASHGHPLLVGSWHTQNSGTRTPINRQLQILKCGELALLVQMPRLHQKMRLIYDMVGPRLARRIRSPWMADVAYLLLKPFEWITRAGLSLLLPDVEQSVRKIYG